MAEITILGCDGCLKPATKRKPVVTVEIPAVSDVTTSGSIDVHDAECIRRYYSRVNKEAREAAKAARAAEKQNTHKR